jgi:adenine-specific DNA methylase
MNACPVCDDDGVVYRIDPTSDRKVAVFCPHCGVYPPSEMPLIRGGQGRTAIDVESSAHAIVAVLVACAIVGVCCAFWAWLIYALS